MKKFLQLVKQAAIEVYESRHPCDIMFGTVKSVSPYEIILENNLILPSKLLVIVNTDSENLTEGERVLLIRKTGGQKYAVIGRIL